MIARVEPGSHFLLLKILYAISNAPKPTVASNVSKAKVSKSVIEHPKVYSCKQYYSPAVAISAGLWYNINEESAVWQTVSTFPVDQQKMIARLVAGRSFFVMKNFPCDIENITAPPLQSRRGCGIIQLKKVLSGKRSAPFRLIITRNDRTSGLDWAVIFCC